jgi:ABC-type taurine transport system ATPase subunit
MARCLNSPLALRSFAGLQTRDVAGIPRASRADLVSRLLKLVNLEDAADKVVAKYSKGMAHAICCLGR